MFTPGNPIQESSLQGIFQKTSATVSKISLDGKYQRVFLIYRQAFDLCPEYRLIFNIDGNHGILKKRHRIQRARGFLDKKLY